MTMITPSYLGETIEYSSLHACRSTLEDPTRLPPRGGSSATLPDNASQLGADRHGFPILFLRSLARAAGRDLRGFGSFIVKETKARQGRNPRTGEPIALAAAAEDAHLYVLPVAVTREKRTDPADAQGRDRLVYGAGPQAPQKYASTASTLVSFKNRLEIVTA